MSARRSPVFAFRGRAGHAMLLCHRKALFECAGCRGGLAADGAVGPWPCSPAGTGRDRSQSYGSTDSCVRRRGQPGTSWPRRWLRSSYARRPTPFVFGAGIWYLKRDQWAKDTEGTAWRTRRRRRGNAFARDRFRRAVAAASFFWATSPRRRFRARSAAGLPAFPKAYADAVPPSARLQFVLERALPSVITRHHMARRRDVRPRSHRCRDVRLSPARLDLADRFGGAGPPAGAGGDRVQPFQAKRAGSTAGISGGSPVPRHGVDDWGTDAASPPASRFVRRG